MGAGGISGRMLALLLACTKTPPQPAAAIEPLTVYVVRHAEKAGDRGDVPLTEAGEARAQALAARLADVPLRGVHSTDTLRTRSTAAPTAAAHGLEVHLYDPRAAEGLLADLQAAGGAHLVVGHSNTVPDLVVRLGGDPGVPIDEATEFDRLYVVTHATPAGSRLERYGEGR